MQIKAAPVIHARTKDVDFRAGLLMVPADFSGQEVKWARKYITDSTRYFELAGKGGRRVVFCNGRITVVGVSIRIDDLYRLCGRQTKYGRVDGNRTNYGFVGFAFHKDELSEAVDIPYSAFADAYERCMEERWEDENCPESLDASKAGYSAMDFPKAKKIYDGFADASKAQKAVLPKNTEQEDSMVAGAMQLTKKRAEFAFCSDMPNATSILESDFMAVTSSNADRINGSLHKKQSSEPAPVPGRESRQETKEEKKIVLLVGGICVAIVAILLLFICKVF